MCAQPKQYMGNWGLFLGKKAEFVMFFPHLVLGIKPRVSYARQVSTLSPRTKAKREGAPPKYKENKQNKVNPKISNQ